MEVATRVVVGICWTSNAPISTVPLLMRGSPRWSAVSPAGMRALLPASRAGLPGSRAWVCVGPPLLARTASRGLMGAAAVPIRLPLTPLAMPVSALSRPTRLFELAATSEPEMSPLVELPATMLLWSVSVPLRTTIPPD